MWLSRGAGKRLAPLPNVRAPPAGQHTSRNLTNPEEALRENNLPIKLRPLDPVTGVTNRELEVVDTLTTQQEVAEEQGEGLTSDRAGNIYENTYYCLYDTE